MFKRLFGETEEEQLHYLQVRVIITLISLVLAFFVPAVFALVMLFVWGWNVVKSLFGITTVGAIFTGNIVFGVVLFLLYIVVAYLSGVVCAALGIGRYIYLMVKKLRKR
ncbi:MAG: hypothetical protein ACI4XW_07530 [Candidatus Spyradocola sp.]